MDTNNDLDAFQPSLDTLKLSTGTVVVVQRLKTRQFFRLLRIVTRGAGQFLMSSQISLNDDAEEFIAKLLGILIVAVPEAEQETIDFMLSMVAPAGLLEHKPLSKADQEINAGLWADVASTFQNPEMEDTVSLFEVIVTREAEDIQALGKRLSQMMTLATKTGQLKTSSTVSEPPTVSPPLSPVTIPEVSSEASPVPLI